MNTTIDLDALHPAVADLISHAVTDGVLSQAVFAGAEAVAIASSDRNDPAWYASSCLFRALDPDRYPSTDPRRAVLSAAVLVLYGETPAISQVADAADRLVVGDTIRIVELREVYDMLLCYDGDENDGFDAAMALAMLQAHYDQMEA